MKEYHKIQTIFKRHQEKGPLKGKIIEGKWTLPEFFYLKDNDWIWTEKVDGTNIRIMFDGENITFGGKTDRAQMPVGLVKHLQSKFLPMIEDFKRVFTVSDKDNVEICLYGEGYGNKIQAGGKYSKEEKFVLFDVKIGEWWLKREDVVKIGKQLDIPVVPVVLIGSIYDAIKIVKEGFNSQWGDFIAEGLVGTPKVPLFTRNRKRIITKLKYNDFN